MPKLASHLGPPIIISKALKVALDLTSLDRTISFKCIDCKQQWNARFDHWKLEDMAWNTGAVHWSRLLESDTHCPKCLAEQKEASR